jgi:hypothetical protein
MKHLINKWFVGLLIFFQSSFAIGQNVSLNINTMCANSTACNPFLNDYPCDGKKLRTTHGSPKFYSLTSGSTTTRLIELQANIVQSEGNTTYYSEGLTLEYSFKKGTLYTIKVKYIGIQTSPTSSRAFPLIIADLVSNPPRYNQNCNLGIFPWNNGNETNDPRQMRVLAGEALGVLEFQPTKDFSYLWLYSQPATINEVVGSAIYSIEIIDNGTSSPNCYPDANFNFCDPAKVWNGSADVRATNPLTIGCDAFKTSSAPGAGAAFVRRFTAPSITLSPGFVGSATDPSGAIRTLKIIPSTAPCTQQLRVASPISNIKNETEPEKPLMENIQIYPSPSRGLVNINFNRSALLNAEITVVDQSGRVVYQMRNKSESNLVQLNLQHLSNGIYFIKVNAQNKLAVKKLLISK